MIPKQSLKEEENGLKRVKYCSKLDIYFCKAPVQDFTFGQNLKHTVSKYE